MCSFQSGGSDSLVRDKFCWQFDVKILPSTQCASRLIKRKGVLELIGSKSSIALVRTRDKPIHVFLSKFEVREEVGREGYELMLRAAVHPERHPCYSSPHISSYLWS
jgi:hypothetical protein